jgi:hypothetical protein
LGGALLLRKIFITKYQKKFAFFKFWAMALIFGFVMATTFTRPDDIVVITSALYIIDVSAFELENENQV